MSNPNAMTTLVGRMKVEELARLAGLKVGELVATVLGQPSSGGAARPRHERVAAHNGASVGVSPRPASPRPASPRPAGPRPVSRTPRRRGRASVLADVATGGTVAPLPELTEVAARGTYRQAHRAVDRWLLGHVFDQEAHNVSRAARRLEISRRRFRELFARTTEDEPLRAEDELPFGMAAPASPAPKLEPLLAKGTYRQIHDALDRWLLAEVLAWMGGNLSHAARHLDVSRKHLREHLTRVGLRE